MTEHLGYEKNSNEGDNSNLRFARQQPERHTRKLRRWKNKKR
jgi:hypothetical protein